VRARASAIGGNSASASLAVDGRLLIHYNYLYNTYIATYMYACGECLYALSPAQSYIRSHSLYTEARPHPRYRAERRPPSDTPQLTQPTNLITPNSAASWKNTTQP